MHSSRMRTARTLTVEEEEQEGVGEGGGGGFNCSKNEKTAIDNSDTIYIVCDLYWEQITHRKCRV